MNGTNNAATNKDTPNTMLMAQGKLTRKSCICPVVVIRKGKKVMRLDTYEGNLPANTMYPKLGYTFVGGTEFFFQGFIREILNCYDKKL